MSPELVLSLIALAGTVIGSILQYLNNRSAGKKAEAEGNVALVEIALKLNRTELETTKVENTELRKKIKDLEEETEILKLSLEAVKCELEVYKKK